MRCRLLSLATVSLFAILPACASAPASEPPRLASTELTAGQPETSDVQRAASFPREDAVTALRAAEGGLRSCNESAAPGVVDVTLRFEPSGKVSHVDVAPAEGIIVACVQERLRQVSVMSFDGEPATFHTTVKL